LKVKLLIGTRNLEDAASCYRYAAGVSVDEAVLRMIPSELSKRELAINEQIVLSARTRGAPENTDSAWAKIRKSISQRGYADGDLQLLSTEIVPASAYARYCSVVITFYQAIVELPSKEAGAVLRELFAEG
jgi:hypothetical protein